MTRLRASRIPALLLRHRRSVGCATGVPADCATGVPGAVGPACPLTVRATSFARRVGSKPGQAAAPPAPSTLVARCACPAHVTCSPRASSPLIPTNFACNSPVTISNHEFTALELQRFQTLLNLHLIELHATFVGEQASLPAGALHTGGAWCVPWQASWPRRCPLPGLIRIGCAHADRLCTSG